MRQRAPSDTRDFPGEPMKPFYLASFLILCVAFNARASAYQNFQIQGTNSLRGDYVGWLRVDDLGRAERVIQYSNFKFENLIVQEAWVGKLSPSNSLIFQLSQAHYIYKVNQAILPIQSVSSMVTLDVPFRNPLILNLPDKSLSTESFKISHETIPFYFQLHLNRFVRDVDTSVPPLVLPAIEVAKLKYGWSDDPAVQSYAARGQCVESFWGPKARAVEDFTDQGFYKQFPNLIRAYNSPGTTFSLAESIFRKSAFSLGLNEKVNLADQAMKTEFINPLGMISLSSAKKGQFRFHIPDGDSALWTGQYISYLANKYNKQKDSETLARIKRSAHGLMLLVELLNGTKEFARTIEEYIDGEKLPPNWKVVTVGSQKFKLLLGGNNDMYKGLLLGLIEAEIAVPATDREFHERLRRISKIILELKIQNRSNATKALSYGLAALTLESSTYRGRFRDSFFNVTSGLMNIYDGTFYWNGTSDYSGINLGIVGSLSSFLLAEKLNLPDVKTAIEKTTLRMNSTFKKLHHVEVLMLLKRIKSHHVAPYEFDFMERKIQEIPYPVPDLTISYDHSYSEDFCLSPIPFLFWKAFSKKMGTADEHVSTLTNLPLYASTGISSNFVLKDAYFHFRGQTNGTVRYAPVPILFAWAMLNP